MAAKKCGYWTGHRWAKKTKIVRPGTYQKRCTKCGRVKNVKCGTFFQPHRFKRDKRRKGVVFTCKLCSTKKVGQ